MSLRQRQEVQEMPWSRGDTLERRGAQCSSARPHAGSGNVSRHVCDRRRSNPGALPIQQRSVPLSRRPEESQRRSYRRLSSVSARRSLPVLLRLFRHCVSGEGATGYCSSFHCGTGDPAARKSYAAADEAVPPANAGCLFPGDHDFGRQSRDPLYDPHATVCLSAGRIGSGHAFREDARVGPIRRCRVVPLGGGGSRWDLPGSPVVFQRVGLLTRSAWENRLGWRLRLRPDVARRQQRRLGTRSQTTPRLGRSPRQRTAGASDVLRRLSAGILRTAVPEGGSSRTAGQSAARFIRHQRASGSACAGARRSECAWRRRLAAVAAGSDGGPRVLYLRRTMTETERPPSYHYALAGVLLAVFLAQSFFSSLQKSPVYDEPPHIASGLSYLATGV